MKRYEFSLATVKRVRQLQEGIAKTNVQRANLAALAAEGALARSLAHYQSAGTGAGTGSFLADRERATFAARAAIESQEALAVARDIAHASIQDYVASARELSVLEHVDDRLREEHATAVLHEEALLADELSGARHLQRLSRLRRRTKG